MVINNPLVEKRGYNESYLAYIAALAAADGPPEERQAIARRAEAKFNRERKKESTG